MHYLRRLTWLAVAGLNMATLAPACSDRAWLSESPNDSGKLDLALQLPSEAEVNTVHYELSGPNGYSLTGDIDVTGASRITHVFERLPAGSYTIALSTVGAGSSPACSGSADFVIRAHATTSVTVNLQCRLEGRTGSVVLNGKLNVCPNIDALAAVPQALLPGQATQLSALTSDFDGAPSALTYVWQASAGTFSDPTAKNTTFTATAPGTFAVTLTVSDGDCADTWTLDVQVLVAPADSTSPEPAPTNEQSATTEALDPSSSGVASETVDSAAADTSASEDTSQPSAAVAPALLATAVAPRVTGTQVTSVALPNGVETGDLAVAFLLATGTPHTLTAAPAGFVNQDLAAINHRLSTGVVGSADPLTWTLSANATTSATVYFFRGDQLSVHVAATSSSSGAHFDAIGATTGPATSGASTGFALFSIQLPVSNTPNITTGPGGNWATPVSDGVQLFTWHQPYAWGHTGVDFGLPGVNGSVLSASATKRTAQVVVYAPAP